MTSAEKILSLNVKQVAECTRKVFFNEFAKHYNLNKEQIADAMGMFNTLKKTDITLNLALITAVTFARMA